MYYNMSSSNIIHLKPGKNLIDIKNYVFEVDISNKNIKLTFQLSNSKNLKESVYIVNKNKNKVYKTDIKNTTWYNEVGNDIIINCVVDNVEDIGLLCYSNSYHVIDLSDIVKTDFYFYEITPVEYYNTPYVRRRDKLVGTVYLEKER